MLMALLVSMAASLGRLLVGLTHSSWPKRREGLPRSRGLKELLELSLYLLFVGLRMIMMMIMIVSDDDDI